ncbi:hypothetical protein B0H14DRAFT_2751219 [Mycena olivaceomarginata]|nr:hypothetical protein B0H14DRAFT_2751219 [Mycena olivaceomarginata]
MPPSSPLPTESDCRATVDIAAGTLFQSLPCLRCTLIGLTCLIVVVFLVRLLSPTRLCGTMKNSLNVAERVYHGSVLAGMLNPSFQLENGESLRSLQCRVSHVEERRVRNSLRPWCTILDTCTGHSFVIIGCIWDIQILKNRIEMLQESHLRELLGDSENGSENANPLTTLTMRHTRPVMCNC